MFLSKHRSTPGGGTRGSMFTQLATRRHAAAAATLAPRSSIFIRMSSADHSFPYCAFSLRSAPTHTHTHTHTHTQTSSPSPSLSPDPRPFQYFSSDFPVVHWRVADQYIITGFEAYIYYRSDAINTVISLLPLA